MRRDALLVGGAGAVVLGLLLAAVLAPGIAANPAQERIRQSHTDIRDTAFSAERVGGETVTLNVTTLFEHRGGPASNLTVSYRMVDSETGLVVARATRDLGDVSGDREVETSARLTVEREGDYELRTFLYENGRRIDTAESGIRGTGNLVPAYAESTVEFHQFAGARGIPAVQYGIDRADDGQVRVNVTAYLTNGGDELGEGFRVQLVARQADSNIVADSASVPVGEIRPGRSVTPTAELTVPDNYTYYLDAVLWKDGVIVGSARATADLNPRRSVGPNTTDVDLDSGEFAAETDTAEPVAEPEATRSPTPAPGQPGFGLAVGVVALCGLALLARRWSP